MKKLIFLLLLSCLILGNAVILCSASSDFPTVTVSCDSTCNANGQITVSVDLSNVTSDSAYCGISFGLIYDKDNFAYSSHTTGAVISGDAGIDSTAGEINPTASENEIYVSYAAITPKTDNGNIIKIVFDVLPDAKGESDFTLSNLKIKNDKYQSIVVSQVYASTLPLPILKVDIADDIVKGGDSVTVNIALENASNYCGFSFGLIYDSTRFTYVSHSAGSVISGFANINPSAGENEVYVNFATATPISDNGSIISVVFTAHEYVNTESDFTIQDFKLKNDSYQNIASTIVNDSVRIECVHKNVQWEMSKAPQCEANGLERFECICGYYQEREITKTGHSFGEWIVDKEPSIDQEGHRYRVCDGCGKTENETIPRIESGVFSITKAAAVSGDTVELDLSLKVSAEIDTVTVPCLYYDKEKLEFIGFSNYSHIEELCSSTPVFDYSNECISFEFTEPQPFEGRICTLVFKVNENVQECSTTVSATAMIESCGKAVSTIFNSGSVNVYEYVFGDINENGDVDIDDALYLYGYTMLPDYFPISYLGEIDFNDDGVIDLQDAVMLFNYSMLPDIYPLF